MTEIAEAYIHLRPYEVSERALQQLGRATDRAAYRIARRIYGDDVELEVTLEEASLKTWVTVSAVTLFTLYGGVADYKGFKESIAEMCNDARTFGFDVCSKVIGLSDVGQPQIYRKEKRLKTPGKIARLIKRLEKLESGVGELSPKDVQRELYVARRELETILESLSTDDAETLTNAIKPRKLPPVSRWPHDLPEGDRVGLREQKYTSLLLPFAVEDTTRIRSVHDHRQLRTYHNSFSTGAELPDED